jgi:hypothetical protein
MEKVLRLANIGILMVLKIFMDLIVLLGIELEEFLKREVNLMKVYRVFKDRINEGYWFKPGGIPQENQPPEPMDFIERDFNYVSCTETPEQDMLYFPKERIEKLGGKFGIFEVDEKYIKRFNGDSVSPDGYMAFDWRQSTLEQYLTFDEFVAYTKAMKSC